MISLSAQVNRSVRLDVTHRVNALIDVDCLLKVKTELRPISDAVPCRTVYTETWMWMFEQETRALAKSTRTRT